ncbi:MAG: hypothetical protein KAT62_04865 [Desulfuromonadales bacterium]|nr:hypothetical protein [Desulfuromonadales bacterium]
MAENLSISGPVEIQSDSKQRVAYDLMGKIAYHDKAAQKDKKYWLSLYCQCLKATTGSDIEFILKEE